MTRKTTLFALALSLALVVPVAAQEVATVSGEVTTITSFDSMSARTRTPGGVLVIVNPPRVAILAVETASGETALVLVTGPDLLAEADALTPGDVVSVRARWGETAYRGAFPLDVDFLAIRFID